MLAVSKYDKIWETICISAPILQITKELISRSLVYAHAYTNPIVHDTSRPACISAVSDLSAVMHAYAHNIKHLYAKSKITDRSTAY